MNCKKVANGIAFFNSGIYENALDKVKQYIKINYENCKICVMCESKEYKSIHNMFDKINSTFVCVFSDVIDSKTKKQKICAVVKTCSLMLCLNENSINFAKEINAEEKIGCIFLLNKFPTLDFFLPLYYSKGIVKYKEKEVKNFYAININENSVEDVYYCLLSFMAYFCNFLENYINYKLYEKNCTERNTYIIFAKRLYNLLNKEEVESNNFKVHFYNFIVDFSTFLAENLQNFSTKENIFSLIYKKLDNEHKLNYNEVRFLCSQLFIKLYINYFKKFAYKSKEEKIINRNFNMNLYILNKIEINKNDLYDNCVTFEKIFKKLSQHIYKLGSKLKNNLKNVNKICFCNTFQYIPYLVKKECFLLTVRKY